MKTRHLLISLALGLGLTLALLWLLEGVARADATPVHYVAPTGADSPDCANLSTPCRTVQYAVDQAGAGDEIRVVTGVYTGVQARDYITQVVYISKTVTLRGGYTTAFTDPPDPDANPTTLDAQWQGRVIAIVGDITPTIEGFIITRGWAAGLGGPWGEDAGGGIFSFNASPIIQSNVITNNDAGLSSPDGGGIYCFASATALIRDNTISNNWAEDMGGGLYVDGGPATVSSNVVSGNTSGEEGGGIGATSSPGVRIVSNTISGNQIVGGNLTTGGKGGGILVELSDGAFLDGNVIVGNIANIGWPGFDGRGYGGGLHIYASNNVTVTGNVITDNVGSLVQEGYGGGVYLEYSTGMLTGNRVISNTATYIAHTSYHGYGGGLFLDQSPATLTGNTVQDNLASVFSKGYGGGLFLDQSPATLTGNTIRDNVASKSTNPALAASFGGGLYLNDSDGAALSGNSVVNNTASTGRPGDGGGLYLKDSDATLSDNTVQDNIGSTAHSGTGGGLYLDKGDPTLSDNTVQGNTASTADDGTGGGLYLYQSDATLSGNTVQSNVASAVNDGSGGGLYVFTGNPTLSGNTVTSNTATLNPAATGQGGGLALRLGWDDVFTLTNNLVADNHANTEGSGLWLGTHTSGRLLHTTIADNGSTGLTMSSSGQGVFVGGFQSTLAFTNTIIAGHHSVGITVTTGSTVTLEATLWHDNGATTGGGGAVVIGAVNISGDPAFVAPALWNYHIAGGSAAMDAGVDAGVATDIDGESRDANPDIGADELVHYTADLSIGKVAHTSVVTAGQPITYTLTITNGGPEGPAAAAVVDTLDPASAVGGVSWSGGTCQRVGGVVTCTVPGITTATPSTLYLYVTTARTYSGTLSNTAIVTGAWNTVDTNPANSSAGPVHVTVTAAGEWHAIYLPVVLKNYAP